MKGGENLLELLGSGNFGRWIIIHGHRHYPRICYAAGSTSAPVIFGAGSLCAKLYGDIQNRARNQFYLLAFPWERFDELQLQLAGRFSAWDWITAKGWQRAGSESGLPAFGGFGFRPETTYVAQDLMKFSIRSPYATWKEVLETFPKLDFMVPDDLATLEGECATRHKLKLLRDANGSIVQIGSVP